MNKKKRVKLGDFAIVLFIVKISIIRVRRMYEYLEVFTSAVLLTTHALQLTSSLFSLVLCSDRHRPCFSGQKGQQGLCDENA